MDSVKEVFDTMCPNLVFDTRLARKIKAIQVGFVNKNTEHAEFFGGHLLGVNSVKFLPSDAAHWFSDILDVDYNALRDNLHALPFINPAFKVSSDVFNLSAVWLVHRFFTSDRMSDKEKIDAMVDVLLVLHYRYMTSRLSVYYKYPANPEIAEATFRKMSMKFAIKQHGTWFGVLHNRAMDIISNSSIHRTVIERMDDDLKIVNMLNDTQGRINNMVKGITDLFIKTHARGERISTSSDVIESDGENILKDKINGLTIYTQYLKNNISDRNSFIKDALLLAVVDVVKTSPEQLVVATLEWISDNYGKSIQSDLEYCIDEILMHSFNYLNEHKSALRKNININGLIQHLKGVYMSSRSTDPQLLMIREKTESIVIAATKRNNPNVVSAVRTAVMLYIVARTFSKHHYG